MFNTVPDYHEGTKKEHEIPPEIQEAEYCLLKTECITIPCYKFYHKSKGLMWGVVKYDFFMPNSDASIAITLSAFTKKNNAKAFQHNTPRAQDVTSKAMSARHQKYQIYSNCILFQLKHHIAQDVKSKDRSTRHQKEHV